MPEFHTSLLRERYVIEDKDSDPVIALSNRITVPLDNGRNSEIFVIRSKNMHSGLRFAAHLATDFSKTGSILKRKDKYDWEGIWKQINKDYEEKWNEERWVTIYHEGEVIFESRVEGIRPPFLDIVEQCDARNNYNYEETLTIAEEAFEQAGKNVSVDHSANVACIINIYSDKAKCGVILRRPDQTTTFNFTAHQQKGPQLTISQCLTVTAAFLEGIHLAFLIGMTNIKREMKLIDAKSEDAFHNDAAQKRLGRLNKAINMFENQMAVSYKPERPNFAKVIYEAENFAKDVLARDLKKKIESGETDGEWII
jgi:hypothetical protein